MPLTFVHIKTWEKVVAETEPIISAFLNSSDLNPNGIVQDMGWRLAPEVVIEMRRIMADPEMMRRIAADYKIPSGEVDQTQVLRFIASKTPFDDMPEAQKGDFSDRYLSEIQELWNNRDEVLSDNTKKAIAQSEVEYELESKKELSDNSDKDNTKKKESK